VGLIGRLNKKGISRGLKPASVIGLDVRAEARTYLRNNNGYLAQARPSALGPAGIRVVVQVAVLMAATLALSVQET